MVEGNLVFPQQLQLMFQNSNIETGEIILLVGDIEDGLIWEAMKQEN